MALERLLKGFADFRLGYYREHLDLFEKLAAEGQAPKILIVACADASPVAVSTIHATSDSCWLTRRLNSLIRITLPLVVSPYDS